MSKILIIEDNDNIRENLLEFLETKGFKVEEAKNGYIGVQKILKSNPDLVLCDIMMPELDGYEVLETIRKTPTLANIPFIFLTAKVKQEDLREGMQLGADDYITKPFKMKDVAKAIEARLYRNEIQKKEVNEKIETFKDQLSHVYSHELNTPLNGIIGFVELLTTSFDEFGKHEILDMLGDIKYSAERLNRTARNIMQFASIEKYSNSEESIRNYPIGKIESFKNLLENEITKNLERDGRLNDLHLELHDGKLKISKEDLLKIMTELTDNACKFSQAGEKIKVRSKAVSGKMLFSVEDNGIGSKELNIDSIGAFIQFNKEQNATQGMGLGLYFVKNLCMLNNADFELSSVVNKGTTARISIPME